MIRRGFLIPDETMKNGHFQDGPNKPLRIDSGNHECFLRNSSDLNGVFLLRSIEIPVRNAWRALDCESASDIFYL